MQLSILIPTYNRCADLLYNLSLLEEHILANNLLQQVCVIVSDNASSDNTYEKLLEYKSYCDIQLLLHKQVNNVGYAKNLLDLIKIAKTEWIMLLGDDDYLEPTYITDCLHSINNNPNLGCIIPNYRIWESIKKELCGFREENCETMLYKAGFEACLANAWRAHQLSGLSFKRAGIYEEYTKYNMNNLYPQIFFVAYSALRYDVLHFGHFCLRVSAIPQTQKDWNYGNDGLMNDIFQNFRYLKLPIKKRALLEAEFNKKSRRYYWINNDELRNIWIDNILNADNLSILGSYYISKQILRDHCYTGKKFKLRFYLLSRISLFKSLVIGKNIGI